MKLKVTHVEFDFGDGLPTAGGADRPSDDEEDHVVRQTIGKVYEADGPEALADAISDDTGWCVFTLDYEEV